MITNKAEVKEPSVKISYLDENDKLRVAEIGFGKYYLSYLSYKENVQDAVAEMAEEGAFWLNENRIIPFHRVRYIDCVPYECKEKSKNKDACNKVEEKNEDTPFVESPVEGGQTLTKPKQEIVPQTSSNTHNKPPRKRQKRSRKR